MKKLSFIMAVLMILMCMPIMAISAAETNEETGYVMSDADKAAVDAGTVVKTGDSYFKTIAEGIKAAADGGTVYVLKGYTFPARETWALEGKDVTVDLLGNTVMGYPKEGENGRSVNVNAFGTTYMAAGKTGNEDPANASTVTIANGTLDSTNGAFFQVYNFMTVTLDNVDCYIRNTTTYGSAILCGDTTLNVVNGSNYYSDVKNGASAAANNSASAAFRGHAKNVTINVEDSYVYANGCIIKSANENFYLTFKNSVVETGNRTAFVIEKKNTEITAVNTTFNVYTKGKSDSNVAAFIWAHSATNNKVTLDGCKITAPLASGQCLIQNENAANSNCTGMDYTFNNVDVITTGGDATFKVAGDIALTINGGSWVCDNRLIYSFKKGDKEQAKINIYDGAFVVKKNNSSLTDFTGITPLGGAIMCSNGKEINVYGGTFTLFGDDGITLNSTCPVLYSWGGAKDLIQVYGGTFNGGNAFLGRVNYSGNESAPYDEAGSVIYTHTYGNSTSFAPVVKEGAAVRLDKNSSGLRFTSVVSGMVVKYIEESLKMENTDVSYGTMIVPSDYVKYAGGVLTMEAFDKAGKAYLNIEAKDGVTVDENGNVIINAALVNIKEENFKRDFIAVSYIKYTDKTGAEVIKYAQNVSLGAFSRNVQEVAHAALADVLTTAAGTYVNKVDGYYTWNQNARKYEFTPGVAYSRYNAEQVAVLKSYIVD